MSHKQNDIITDAMLDEAENMALEQQELLDLLFRSTTSHVEHMREKQFMEVTEGMTVKEKNNVVKLLMIDRELLQREVMGSLHEDE
jgi:hypothetical protein